MPWGAISLDWSAITRYDDAIHAAADPVGWPVERVRGHIVIESQGESKATQRNPRNGDSYGLMQVVPYGVGWEGWHLTVKKRANLPKSATPQQVIAALTDPAINIAVGVDVLESFYQQYGKLDRASSAFFLGNPDWRGQDSVNGNTGTAYHDCLAGLIAEQGGPAPAAGGDIVAVIVGGQPTNTDYGFKSPTDLPYYAYFEGHGGTRWQHTGIDATGWIGQPLYSPIAGTVVCGGTGVGAGAHGSSCAAFEFTLGAKTGSSGRFEIVTDDGVRSLILGHVQRSLVGVGQRVSAGQEVALMGGENGPHCHIEARIWRNGDYTIVDPRQAFGGGPLPVAYAERLDWLPKPSEWDGGQLVSITRDGVKLLQRARKDSAEVASPFGKGESFKAVAIVYTVDEDAHYWVTLTGTRVPIEGTSSTLLGER